MSLILGVILYLKRLNSSSSFNNHYRKIITPCIWKRKLIVFSDNHSYTRHETQATDGRQKFSLEMSIVGRIAWRGSCFPESSPRNAEQSRLCDSSLKDDSSAKYISLACFRQSTTPARRFFSSFYYFLSFFSPLCLYPTRLARQIRKA